MKIEKPKYMKLEKQFKDEKIGKFIMGLTTAILLSIIFVLFILWLLEKR
jgi:hypothetical protein